jgi:heme A synthase
VDRSRGAVALRRDERTQSINDKSARNAFVVTTLALAGVMIYAGSTGALAVSLATLHVVLGVGVLSYFASDLYLRRS